MLQRIAKKGFTLIELIIVVIIMGIILGTGFFSYARFITEAKKDEVAEEIVSVLHEAKKKTLARNQGFTYGVHLTENSFTLFRAPTYSASGEGNESHIMPVGFRLSNISLQGGGADVIFLPLNGETNTVGSFIIEHTRDRVPSSTIHIYATGVIEIE